MDAGRIAQHGAPARALRAAGHAFVAGFMGEFEPRARQRTPPRSRHGQRAAGRGRDRNRRHGHAADGEATVAVRPEAITVELAPGPAGALPGKIAKASYLGTHMEYSIDTAAGTLFATCPRVERPLSAGTAVAVTLAPRGVIIVRQ